MVVFRSAAVTDALRALRVILHRLRGTPHEADFYFLEDARFADGLLLDLGANLGQSALSVKSVQPRLRVLSLEPNPACEPGLRMAARLLGDGFEYRMVGVGARPGTLEFYVPVRASRMLLEEGTFDLAGLHSDASQKRNGRPGVDFTIATLQLPVITVDSLGIAPSIVKMDLQGYELNALQGMQATLRASAPVLMIERGPVHDDVVSLLSQFGYVEHHWTGSRLARGALSDALNAIFLPAGSDELAPVSRTSRIA